MRDPGLPSTAPRRQEWQQAQDGAAGAQDAALQSFHVRFRQAPYYSTGRVWDDYAPAYRYGLDSFVRHGGQHFEDVEAALARNWCSARGGSRLGWVEARGAVADGWRCAEAASHCRGDDARHQAG